MFLALDLRLSISGSVADVAAWKSCARISLSGSGADATGCRWYYGSCFSSGNGMAASGSGARVAFYGPGARVCFLPLVWGCLLLLLVIGWLFLGMGSSSSIKMLS